LGEVSKKEIIDRIVEEVLYRLKEAEPKEIKAEGTSVLVTSYIPSFVKVSRIIKDRFGDSVTFIDFSGNAFPSRSECVVSAEEVGSDNVLGKINGSANVVLLAPRLRLLKSIAQGNDEGFVEYLIIRSLLWGRNVNVLLDFNPPDFKRNTFYEGVIDVLDVLREIGVEIISYDCSYEPLNARSLVTEGDVVDAWKNGQGEIQTAAGCIVTPSARDKSAELGVEIN
jgi:hypothetical protein